MTIILFPVNHVEWLCLSSSLIVKEKQSKITPLYIIYFWVLLPPILIIDFHKQKDKHVPLSDTTDWSFPMYQPTIPDDRAPPSQQQKKSA